jgi:2-aminobenzoate-CoA ligase
MSDGSARRLPAAPTGHVDTFVRDRLPPVELWPDMDFGVLPELNYPDRLNCASAFLDHHVQAGDGERIALRCDDGDWTYRRLFETSNRIAHVLIDELGVLPGHRVLLRGPNSAMMAACWFGVLKAGGICVTTMPLLRSRELAVLCEKAQIALALTDARLTDELTRAAGVSPHLQRIVDFDTLAAMLPAKPAVFQNIDTAADDVAIIAFTSGTTGVPKGTVHFHRDILAICDCFPPHVLQAERADVFCGSPPLAFTFGLGGLLLFPLHIGASAVLLEESAPPKLLQAIQRHRVTVCFTAPTAYRAMASQAESFDLSSLRKCVSAGEPLPRATFELWQRVTGIRIIDGIGSTEMLHIFISAGEEEIRPGSTGRVVPGYEARVVDEDGHEVPRGTIGRLAVRGPTGCRYLDDVERQCVYVQNGWNLTGDAYLMDQEGYFWYQARTDDLIISAGYNIAGPEIENVLLEHPCVAECGVVGLPDEERGQIVTAFVVLRSGFSADDATVAELQDFVKRTIAAYKYPRRIRFVDRLPRTQTGKLQRFRLRELDV